MSRVKDGAGSSSRCRRGCRKGKAPQDNGAGREVRLQPILVPSCPACVRAARTVPAKFPALLAMLSRHCRSHPDTPQGEEEGVQPRHPGSTRLSRPGRKEGGTSSNSCSPRTVPPLHHPADSSPGPPPSSRRPAPSPGCLGQGRDALGTEMGQREGKPNQNSKQAALLWEVSGERILEPAQCHSQALWRGSNTAGGAQAVLSPILHCGATEWEGGARMGQQGWGVGRRHQPRTSPPVVLSHSADMRCLPLVWAAQELILAAAALIPGLPLSPHP